MATVTLPIGYANFETTLALKMSDSATSLTLSRSTDDDGASISGTFILTIDEGTSTEEHMLVTLSGAAGTIVTRGLSRVDGVTSKTANKFEHDRGTTVKITDFALVSILRLLNGTDSFNSVDLSGINSITGLAAPSAATEAARKSYVDAVATAAGGISSFLVTDAGGLTIDIAAGILVTDDGIVEYAGASGTSVTDSATNYVMVDTDGTVVINTSGWIASYVPLAKVTCSGGDITTVEDARGWLTSPSADRTITDDYTYGATIAANDVLYLDTSDGKWKLADASAEATSIGSIGIALDAGEDTDTGKRVQTAGFVTGLTGLTVGWVYLSDTAGDLSSSAGTFRKIVGYAPTTTTLLLIPTFGVEQLDGANSDATTENLNTAMTFHNGSSDQTTSVYATAGEDLTAGDLVAIESDGEVYKTRITGFGTENTQSEVAATEDYLVNSNIFSFKTSDSTDRVFVYLNGSAAERIAQVVYDSDRLNYSSDTVSNITFSALTPTGIEAIELETDKIAVMTLQGGTAEVNAISTLAGSISQGTQQSVGTGAAERAMAKYNSTTFVIFTGTGSTTGIQTHKCTVSGVTITVGAAQTMLSTGNDVQQITGAYKMSGDYFVVTYYDATEAQHKMLIGEWNSSTGAWTTVGTPVNIGTAIQTGTMGRMEATTDEDKVFYTWRNGTTLYYGLISRATTTPSIAATGSVSQRDEGICLTRLGSNTYAIGCANSGTSEPCIELLTTSRDLDAITQLDSVDISGGDSVTGVVSITPSRIATMFSDGTNLDTKTIDLATNLSGKLGFVENNVDENSSAKINVSGTNNSLSGLTAGSKYYADMDGGVTTDTATGEVAGRAMTTTKIKID